MEEQDKKYYNQIVVWPACILLENEITQFGDWFKTNGYHEPLVLENVKTLPDRDNSGNIVPDTGGRNDLFFKIHDDDISKFSVWRLQFGMRWWEDVLDNNKEMYSREIKNKYPRRW